MEGIPEEDRLAHERTKTGKFKFALSVISTASLHTPIYACMYTVTHIICTVHVHVHVACSPATHL